MILPNLKTYCVEVFFKPKFSTSICREVFLIPFMNHIRLIFFPSILFLQYGVLSRRSSNFSNLEIAPKNFSLRLRYRTSGFVCLLRFFCVLVHEFEYTGSLYDFRVMCIYCEYERVFTCVFVCNVGKLTFSEDDPIRIVVLVLD